MGENKDPAISLSRNINSNVCDTKSLFPPLPCYDTIQGFYFCHSTWIDVYVQVAGSSCVKGHSDAGAMVSKAGMTMVPSLFESSLV